MQSLKQMSSNRLNKMLAETQAELKRRENIDKAREELKAVLKKYNITIEDIDFGNNIRRQKQKRRATKISPEKKDAVKKATVKKQAVKAARKTDKRTTVAAKHHNPETGDTWSGRGRPPVWVTNLCAAEAINIVQFKAESRFRI